MGLGFGFFKKYFVSAAFIIHADTWVSCKARDQPLHIRRDLGFTLDVSVQIPFGDFW